MTLQAQGRAVVHHLPIWVQRIIDRVVAILVADYDMSEAVLAIGAFVCGIWLLIPYWDTFESARGFTAMADVAPENWWGSLFLLVSGMHLWGTLTQARRTRIWAAFIALFVWSVVSLGFLQSNVAGLAGPTFAIFALLSLWVAVRAGRE